MKQFLMFFLSISCLFVLAVEEPLDTTMSILSDSNRFASLKKNEMHEFKSKPIDFKTHFDESVQAQKKFEKKQKNSGAKSKLLSESLKTERKAGLMFHDSDFFESKPIDWHDLESDSKVVLAKKEHNIILSQKTKKDIDRLAQRYEFKKKNSAQALQEEQRKIDELNALLDKAVWDINNS